ncbi:MAG: PAS domain-containing protein [Gemmatimonadaceae bacterium]
MISRSEPDHPAPLPGGASGAPPTPALRPAGRRVSRRRFFAAYFVAVLLVGAGGVFGFTRYERRAGASYEQMLLSIVRLQVRQITSLFAERASDANLLSRQPVLLEALGRRRAASSTPRGDARLNAYLEALLSELATAHDYHGLLVADRDLRTVAAVAALPDHLTTAEAMQGLAGAIRSRRLTLVDLRASPGGHMEFGLAVPVFAGADSTKPVIGAILVLLDARRALFSRFDNAMALGKTTETVLARVTDTDIAFAYSTKYLRASRPFSVRRSSADTSLIPVKAFMAQAEIVGELPDYRGVRVVAAASPVPGTPWVIVTKTDDSEVDAPLVQLALAGVAFLLVLMGLGASIARSLWLERQRDVEAEESVVASRYMAATMASMDGYLMHDVAGRLLDANAAMERITGYSRDELLALSIEDLRWPAEPGVPRALERIADLLQEGAAKFTSHWRSRSGASIEVEVSATVLREGGERRVVAFVRDITAVSHTRRHLEALNALYLFLGRANEAIFQSRSADELYEAVCRGAVADGNLVLAWVGVADWNARVVRVAAASGAAAGYVADLRISLDTDDPAGQGPTGVCIRTGKSVVRNDFLASAMTGPWHQAGMRFGIGASVSVPVTVGGTTVAAVMFYARDKDFFTDDLVAALEEVGRNTAMSLEKYTADEARREEERLRRASEDRLLEAQRIARVCSWELDLRINRMIWSDEAYRILELAPDPEVPLTLQTLLDRLHPDDRDSVAEAFRAALEARSPFELSFRLLLPDGLEKYLLIRCRSEFLPDGSPLRSIGMLQDVTDQRAAALELARHRDHLEELVSVRTAALEQAKGRLQMSDERLKAMFAMSQQASQLAEYDILRLAVNEAVRMTGSADGYIYLISAEDQTRAEFCLWADEPVPAGGLDAPPRYPVSQTGVWERAARSRMPVLVSEPVEVEGESDLRAERPLERQIAVPHLEDGRVRLVLGVANRPTAYESSDVSELQLIAHDVWTIVQRRRTDLALEEAYRRIRASEQRLLWATDAATEGILDWDLRTNDIYFSDAMLTMLGYQPSEVAHTYAGLLGLVHPEDASRFDAEIQRGLRDAGSYEVEVRMQSKDGTYRWILSRAKVVECDESGKPARVVGAHTDLTNRRRAEDELRAAKVAADEASRAKSAFLAVMSHEIRTPMNGVLGMSEILLQSNLPMRDQEAVRTIQASATNLLTIIDDILDFSKIEAGRLELEAVECSLSEIIDNVYHSLQPLAAARGVDVYLFVDPAMPDIIASDPTRMRQVLYNLVGNAVKFSGDLPDRRGRVSARLELLPSVPGHILLTVADNGIGMSPETIANLFTSFSQAEKSTTRRFGGTGLGLAITKRLVELMHGTIEVTSVLGEGTTFTVKGPLDFVHEQPLSSLPRLDGVECVIVGDASCWDADDLRRYLEPLGARVTVAGGPEAAAAAARPLASPVIIRDVGIAPADVDPVLRGLTDARHVLVTRGQRRTARALQPDVVVLDREFLRARTFVRAVGIAAGRCSPQPFEDAGPGEVITSHTVPSIAEARAQGCLILVAEDDPTNQRVILRQLELLGYAAEVASDGAEALRMWQAGHYALLLRDLHMPEMDGYTLTREIRTAEGTGRRTPIVALTANALRGEEARARSVGMDGYLTKPVPLKALRQAIDTWFHRERSTPAGSDGEVRRGATSARPAFDVTVLESLVGDDPAIVRELLHDFTDAQKRQLAEMQAAVVSARLAEVGAVAHKMKSAARSVGALSLGDLCAELENAGKRSDVSAVDRLVRMIGASSAGVQTEIERYLATPSPS